VNPRIGKGPWARAFAVAVGAAEGGPPVEQLKVEVGLITASVGECTVSLSAPTVPPRIWAAMTSYARNRGALERAVAGEIQSEHLQQLMEQDWDEPLISPSGAIVRLCSCDTGGACEHVAALAYAVVGAIDADPAVLLRWRGCVDDARPASAGDPWRGQALPIASRTMARGSVLHRLGSSGIRVGESDLAEVLQRAYSEFVAAK
jgi:hypothetical protein